MTLLTESPEIQWFDPYPKCRVCRKVSHGILRGTRNESYGDHCTRCASKRIKAALKARKQLRDMKEKPE